MAENIPIDPLTQPERIADINARLNRLIDAEYPEPPCTCTQTDVDFFDARSCDLCNNSSEWNMERRRAESALKDAAFHDLEFLLRVMGMRRESDAPEEAGGQNDVQAFDPSRPVPVKSIP